MIGSIVAWFRVTHTHSKTVLFLLVFVSGCAAESRRADTLLHSGAIERRCGPVATPQRPAGQAVSLSKRHAASGLGSADVLDRRFSSLAQDTADIIGAKDLLMLMAVLEDETDRQVEGAPIRLLQVQQQVSNRILLAFLDVARTAAEADCEEERADQLADRLQEARDKRIRRQTLIAIVGDAMIGIVAGGLSLALEATASAATAILGGSVATGFGLAAFFDNTQYEFQHTRNLLREVWVGPDQPLLIPNSVWQHLTRPLSDDPTRRSLRESLIARWRQDGRFGELGSETEERRIALFFGEGGSYEIEDLRARAAMLDLLEADVNLMSQDLEELMQEVLMHDTQGSISNSFEPGIAYSNFGVERVCLRIGRFRTGDRVRFSS